MAETDRPRQLPLELGHVARLSRDDLIVTPSNAAAVALIDRWPDWSAPLVLLAGPPGSGKSHLAAVWREQAHAVEVQQGGPLDGAIAAAAHAPILFDGVDEGALDETGLFHLINAVRHAGTTMLMTARRFPAGWGVRLADLQSRLRAATLIEIGEPDDALLTGVITKLFADRQIDIEAHVVRYLVRRIERSLSTAIAVVDRLDRAALEQKARVTRALAAEVIGAIDEGQGDFGF